MDLSRATWRKSSHSGVNGCVEVAVLGGAVAVRNSEDPQGPLLVFSIMKWHAFLDGVRDGEFDLGGVHDA
jgi:hypothetical protein